MGNRNRTLKELWRDWGETFGYAIAIVVIAAFLAGVLILLFEASQRSSEISIGKDFFTAFAGAFFAFIFLRLEGAFQKIHERKVRNRNSMVKLEHECNRLFNALHGEIFVIDQFLGSLEEIRKSGQTVICYNELKPISYDRSIVIEFSNLDLVNETFGLFVDLDKLSDSYETFNSVYTQQKEAFMAKRIEAQDFREKSLGHYADLVLLKNFSLDVLKDVRHVSAMARVLLQERTFFMWLLDKTQKRKLSLRDKEAIKKEELLLDEEMAQSKDTSKRRIDEIRSLTDSQVGRDAKE